MGEVGVMVRCCLWKNGGLLIMGAGLGGCVVMKVFAGEHEEWVVGNGGHTHVVMGVRTGHVAQEV